MILICLGVKIIHIKFLVWLVAHEKGNTLAINGERHRTVIKNCLSIQLKETDLDSMFFQQDTATRHTFGEITDILKGEFH